MRRGVTMLHIRTTYWIPSLRKLTKPIIKICFKCKRYRAMAGANRGPLLKCRTKKHYQFQVVGKDY